MIFARETVINMRKNRGGMMDRLTYNRIGEYDLKALGDKLCHQYCEEQSNTTCVNCGIYKSIKKLAHYEDMEEQGKLLIIPCKPEDTVYVISNYSNYRKSDCEIIKAVVTTVRLKSDGKTVCFSCRGKWKNKNPYIGNFTSNSVGKTVFMTEQEAKEALEGMKE